MDGIRENKIIFSLAGLMGALTLIFAVYAYCDYRAECKEIALWEAQSTAENVAVWTDNYFNYGELTDMDVDMSAWEQGVRGFMGAGEEIVVLDGQNRTLFSTNFALDELCQDILENNQEGPFFKWGGGILGGRYKPLGNTGMELFCIL